MQVIHKQGELQVTSNWWKGVVFAAYLALIPIFAWCYWRGYRDDSTAFQMPNGVVLATRGSEVVGNVRARSATLASRSRLVARMIEGLEDVADSTRGFLARTDRSTIEVQSRDLILRFSATPMLSSALRDRIVVIPTGLEVADRSGTVVLHALFYVSDGAEDTAWLDVCDSTVARLKTTAGRRELAERLRAHFASTENDLHEMRSRERALVRGEREPWGGMDFLYFSVVTQTTVGYGDILPASTKMRILVMLQVVAGMVLLGVLISLEFGKRR